jgi:cytoskeleton protein RodZ
MENSMTDETVGAPEESAPIELAPAVGAQLRAAREAAGLLVADVAQTLKLGSRQVEALENGDWSLLPGATFVRGFVRNYARLVGLDGAALTAQLNGVIDRPTTLRSVPSSESSPMPQAGGRRDRNVVFVALLLLVLALVAYVALPGDLQGLRNNAQSLLDSLARQETPAPVTPPAVNQPAALPAGTVVSSEPVFPPGVTAQQLLNPQALTPDAAPAAPATPAVVPPATESVIVTPANTVSPASAVSGSVTGAVLNFVVEKESWIEVRDRNNTVLFSQRLPAGSQQAVSGQGPLSLVIGYAPGVKLTWRGRAVDLAPHSRAEVARLVLE